MCRVKLLLWLALLTIVLPCLVSAEDQCIRVVNATTNDPILGLTCMFETSIDYTLMTETGGLYCTPITNYTTNTTHIYQTNCTDGVVTKSIWGTFTRYQSYNNEVELMSGSIAITIFVLFISTILFLLPFRIKLENEIANLIVRRGIWIVAVYLMVLNCAIMATIAAATGIPVTNELFNIMSMIGWVGYLMMLFMFVTTMITMLRMWVTKKKVERVGGVM